MGTFYLCHKQKTLIRKREKNLQFTFNNLALSTLASHSCTLPNAEVERRDEAMLNLIYVLQKVFNKLEDLKILNVI